MIIQCPSCKSKFKIDSSKISGPSSEGRCSVCGEAFPILDHAMDVIEATELRDRLEDERAERIKKIMEQQKARQQEAEESAAAEADASARKVPEDKGLSDTPEIPAIEVPLEESPFRETMAETERVEDGEESKPEAPKETDRGLGEVQELGAEKEETGEEIITAPELSEQPIQEGKEELTGLEKAPAEEGPDQDSGEQESMGVPLDELEDIEPLGKRSPLMPVLLIILLLVVLSGGGWYLYNSGQSGVFNSIVEKIKGLTGQTSLTLFNLKNEREPALDGKFFAVRGMVQSKRDKSIRFVPLRIKIFNSRNKTILTGQTVAGSALAAEQISKMSVQDVLKKHRAFIKLNKKTKGILGAGKKLPFVFLFDLSRFPRKLAKSFQVEVMGPVKP